MIVKTDGQQRQTERDSEKGNYTKKARQIQQTDRLKQIERQLKFYLCDLNVSLCLKDAHRQSQVER